MNENNEKTNVGDVIKVRGTGTFYLSKNVFDFVAKKHGKPKRKMLPTRIQSMWLSSEMS